MDENLTIPSKDRHKFAVPLGDLIAGTRRKTIAEIIRRIKEILKTNDSVNFYLVGDIVTQDFLANNFLREFIKLCIIDEKTQRKEIKITFEEFFESTFEIENPKGSINKDSFTLLKKIISSNTRTLLRVTKGEEDLLVLPLVQQLPLIYGTKNYVFYGQPPITDSVHPIPEGIVMVDVDKKIQKTVKRFLSIMENKG